MKSAKILLTAAALAVVLGGSAYAKTLVYCSEVSPANFDPGTTTGGNDFDASSRTIYSRLVESWDISPDGLTYTFHLRKGVKFQSTDYFTPTRDLNADDVIFSFMRQQDDKSPWFIYLPNLSYDYYVGMDMPKYTKEWKKVDDNTVQLVLTEPNAPMLANLAMDFASIVSKEYADKLQASGNLADFASKPIGTGPFQFVDYQVDSTIRYAANPDYYKGKEKIDNLIFSIVSNATTRLEKIRAGECDVMAYPNPADVPSIKADANLTTYEQAGLNIGYMSYNTTLPPLDKPEVRHALNMAIDRDALIKALFQDAGATPANNLIPPTMWSWNKDVKFDKYDPDAAKKVLAAAGLTKIDLWAAAEISRPYNPSFQRAAELIQADWAKVGVTANIISLPDRLVGRQWRPGQFLRHPVLLLGHRRVQLFELVRQGLRERHPEGQDHLGYRRAHQILPGCAGGVRQGGSRLPAGALAGLCGDRQEGPGLRPGSARHAPLRRRRRYRISVAGGAGRHASRRLLFSCSAISSTSWR